jgi:cyclic pyranopterin phosphate synthase
VSDTHPEAHARMADVTAKDASLREAVAEGFVRMSPATRDAVAGGRLSKGDALEVARIAGIMAAKKTAELVPLCHPIALGSVEVDLGVVADGVAVTARVRTTDKTGVEMGALVAVTAAALTVYDMVKGTERGVEIDDVRLLSKSGGRSGTWTRPPHLRAKRG